MDRCLGGLLSHQLANPTRVHPMPIKSLLVSSCELTRLCGISDRFQSLSPSERQIAHALLTRPPLSQIPEGKCFVRLACVRHAASVHPEPGSNSLKNCIITSKTRYNQTPRLSGFVCRFVYTGFSTSSGLLSINFKRISGSFVCFKLSLFNLQGTMLFCHSLCEVARLFYHILISLSRTFFISFFKLSCDRRVLSNSDLVILSLSHQLVKRFFQVLDLFQK